MTDAPPPISSKHFDKDDRGRWVVLFGRHDGKRLAQIPSSYLRWMLDNCRFVRGSFRTAVGRVLTQRYQGLAEEPDHDNDCTCYDCDQRDLYDALGLGDCDAPWGDQ